MRSTNTYTYNSEVLLCRYWLTPSMHQLVAVTDPGDPQNLPVSLEDGTCTRLHSINNNNQATFIRSRSDCFKSIQNMGTFIWFNNVRRTAAVPIMWKCIKEENGYILQWQISSWMGRTVLTWHAGQHFQDCLCETLTGASCRIMCTIPVYHQFHFVMFRVCVKTWNWLVELYVIDYLCVNVCELKNVCCWYCPFVLKFCM